MKIHKGDIALDMVEDAIELYKSERYSSSLHLSAAASELLSGLCKINGFESAHGNLIQMLKDFHDSDPIFFAKPQDALKKFNYSKNTIKHISDENDQFAYVSLERDSRMYINQCLRMLEEGFNVCLIKRI